MHIYCNGVTVERNTRLETALIFINMGLIKYITVQMLFNWCLRDSSTSTDGKEWHTIQL